MSDEANNNIPLTASELRMMAHRQLLLRDPQIAKRVRPSKLKQPQPEDRFWGIVANAERSTQPNHPSIGKMAPPAGGGTPAAQELYIALAEFLRDYPVTQQIIADAWTQEDLRINKENAIVHDKVTVGSAFYELNRKGNLPLVLKLAIGDDSTIFDYIDKRIKRPDVSDEALTEFEAELAKRKSELIEKINVVAQEKAAELATRTTRNR